MTFLLRFRAWLAELLQPKTPLLAAHGEENRPKTIKDGAQDLVERSRAGDQNAMALICLVRDNAAKGNVRACQAADEILKYITDNPTEEVQKITTRKLEKLVREVQKAAFAGEFIEAVTSGVPEIAVHSIPKAVVTMANGPNLVKTDKLKTLFDSFESDDERKAFQMGFKHGTGEMNGIPPKLRGPFILGHIIGTAYKLQVIRLPNTPLSIFSASLGAEFGECRPR